MKTGGAITVIIPCFNDGEYLKRSIPSVASQMGDSDEIIVIDDGSVDATFDIVNDLKKQFTECVINYAFQENSGVSKARNRGVEIANNGLLIFLDADDELLPGALSSFRLCLDDYADLYIAGHRWIRNGVAIERTPTLGIDRKQNFEDVLCKRVHIGNLSGMCFKREVFEDFEFDTTLKVGEDLALILLTLATKICRTNPYIAAAVHRRTGSLRDYAEVAPPIKSDFVRSLFNHPALPPEFHEFVSHAQSRYYITLLRLHWQRNNTHEYGNVFRAAVADNWKNLFSKWAWRRLTIALRQRSQS